MYAQSHPPLGAGAASAASRGGNAPVGIRHSGKDQGSDGSESAGLLSARANESDP